jgi:hypothetical protein
MAKSPKTIPNNFPQPLGMEILKAEQSRQECLIRHEFTAGLIQLLTSPGSGNLKPKLLQLAQQHLKAGIKAVEKAQSLWPEEQRAQELLRAAGEKKKGSAKFLQLFREYEACQRKSLKLLHQSHEHIGIILEKLRGMTGSGSSLPEAENSAA